MRAHKIDTKPAVWFLLRSDRVDTEMIYGDCLRDWLMGWRVLVTYEERRQLT